MDEQKKAERIIEKATGENTEEGSEQETGSIIDRANVAAERLKLENDRREALLKREEENKAIDQLSGRSEKSPDIEPKQSEGLDYLNEFKDNLLK